MGIKGLSKFLADASPGGLRVNKISTLQGRTIAIDASMALYQFLAAIREGSTFSHFTNSEGQVTSHINGMLARVTRFLEQGIRPVFVFDGKPPLLKSGELAKRRERREEAEALAESARERGDEEELRKQMIKTIKVTDQHNQDIKNLLKLLGIPFVEAPCEAEAQCAELAKKGKVWATATEDADALTFGTPILIRNLNISANTAQASTFLEINLSQVLSELDFTIEQFVDFCILCGCDYCDTIKGIGSKTAYTLMKEYKTIDNLVENINKEKHPIPAIFPYKEARAFFLNPEVTDANDVKLVWGDIDVEGLRDFLVNKHDFQPGRVDGYIARLQKARGLVAQTRLESFFGTTSRKSSSTMQKEMELKMKKKNTLEKRGQTAAKHASMGSIKTAKTGKRK